jgi:hypothetical protein
MEATSSMARFLGFSATSRWSMQGRVAWRNRLKARFVARDQDQIGAAPSQSLCINRSDPRECAGDQRCFGHGRHDLRDFDGDRNY